jgi:ribosomal protein S8E
MRDQPITRAGLNGFTAAFTMAITALNIQIAALAIQLTHNAKINNINIIINKHHRGKGHVAIKPATAKFKAKEHGVKKCTEIDLFVENGHETNYVLTAKTRNSNTDLPEDESENHEVQKIGDDKELNAIKFVADIEAKVTKKNVSQTPIVEIEKKQRVSFVKLPTKSHEKSYTPSWSERSLME